MRTRLSLVALLLVLVGQITPARSQSDSIQGSATIAADRRVAFRLKLPSVSNVQLVIDGRPPVAMQRDAAGAWSTSVGPLDADIYRYWFTIDGLVISDPLNISGQLHIKGNEALPWEVAQVPHGTIHRHFYRSAIADYERDYYVYTPPGYQKTRDRYPVLYLLHGGGGGPLDWTTYGRVNVMVDSLLAAGKVKPMLLVMPIAYGMPGPRTPANRRENFVKFTEALLNEMIPMIEAEYRVDTSPRARAIAGLSMGAGESLYVGLTNPDRFGAVGAFSSGQVIDLDFDAAFPSLDSKVNSKIGLLWLGCGTDDDTIINNRKFRNWLSAKGVTHTAVEGPGFHEWPVWRRHFITFAQLLFRQ